MVNASWALFPDAGSYHDPVVAFVVLAIAVDGKEARYRHCRIERCAASADVR